jgi:hypothetical protein
VGKLQEDVEKAVTGFDAKQLQAKLAERRTRRPCRPPRSRFRRSPLPVPSKRPVVPRPATRAWRSAARTSWNGSAARRPPRT